MDVLLHINDGRYALIEFKLGEHEIDQDSKHLCEIEELIKRYNAKETQYPLRLLKLKLVIASTKYRYRRDDGVFAIPIGRFKD